MKKYCIVPVIFMTILIAVGIMYFIVPDNEISREENRALASLPEFSLVSLADGSYTAGLNDYMTDQFPMRGSFMKVGDEISTLLTLSGGEVEMVMGVGNTDMGVGENLSGQSLSEASAETAEEEPEEKKPEAAKIELAEEADYNSSGIIIVGSRAMELFAVYYDMLENYATVINDFKSNLPDVNVYSMVVPTSVEFYSPVQYHEKNRSQKDAIETLYSLYMPGVIPVDAYTYLAAEADRYIYFRSDHHWTARGAYQGYYAFCEAAGLEAVPEKDFNVTLVEGDFLGTLYRYTKKQAIADDPDTVEVLVPPEVESCTGYTDAAMTNSYAAGVIEDPGSSTNKYLTFLGGDHPILDIVTNNKNGRRAVVIKDSFGNAFVPFLINHYEEIYVIDPRSVTVPISDFCAQHGVGDVIIENYAFALGNSSILNGLEAML